MEGGQLLAFEQNVPRQQHELKGFGLLGSFLSLTRLSFDLERESKCSFFRYFRHFAFSMYCLGGKRLLHINSWLDSSGIESRTPTFQATGCFYETFTD
jgi:hypothetical protein